MSKLGLAVKGLKALKGVAEVAPRVDREAALAVAMANSKVRDQLHKPRMVYHGTERTFDSFKTGPNDIGMHFGTQRQANARLKSRAEMKGTHYNKGEVVRGAPDTPNVVPAYINLTNPIRLHDPGSWAPELLGDQLRGIYPEDTGRIDRLMEPSELQAYLRDKGHDGVVYSNTGEPEADGDWVLDDLQAKMNDAITRAGSYPGYDMKLDGQANYDALVAYNATPEAREAEAARKAYDKLKAKLERQRADSYIVFDPQQIKSPFNRGTFDMTDPDFMKAKGGHISSLAVKGAKALKGMASRAEREAALAVAMAQSKVRNPDGSPKRLYHGTTKDFPAFDKAASDPHYTSPQMQLGHFLTDDPRYANQYAEFWGDTKGANIMPVYVNMTNPKMEPLSKIDEIELGEHDAATSYRAQLEALGHDGVIFEGTTNRGNPRREFVAFDPKQIKSAFNQGTFDMTDPNLLKARGGSISALAVKRKAKR